MRLLLAPFTWFGRVFLWVFLFPVGVWRSLRHHRRKAEDRAVKRIRNEIRKDGTT